MWVARSRATFWPLAGPSAAWFATSADAKPGRSGAVISPKRTSTTQPRSRRRLREPMGPRCARGTRLRPSSQPKQDMSGLNHGGLRVSEVIGRAFQLPVADHPGVGKAPACEAGVGERHGVAPTSLVGRLWPFLQSAHDQTVSLSGSSHFQFPATWRPATTTRHALFRSC